STRTAAAEISNGAHKGIHQQVCQDVLTSNNGVKWLAECASNQLVDGLFPVAEAFFLCNHTILVINYQLDLLIPAELSCKCHCFLPGGFMQCRSRRAIFLNIPSPTGAGYHMDLIYHHPPRARSWLGHATKTQMFISQCSPHRRSC